MYGADTPGSICDPDLKEFNMNHLNTVLDLLDNFEVLNDNFTSANSMIGNLE